MMNHLNEEVIEFRTHLVRWVAERLIPQAETLDESGTFSFELFRELGELGYLGLMYPEDAGGTGMSYPFTSFTILCEELAYGSMGFAAGVCMHGSTATHTIHAWGNETLKNLYLKPALRGEKVGAFAITEPNAGSDAASLRAKAIKVQGGYLLSGSKIFTTNGTVADFITVVATVDPKSGAKGLELFVVDTKSNGFDVGRKLDKFSIHCSDTAELVFDELFVPDDHCLGDGQGSGFLKAYQSLTIDRIFTAALAIGTGRAAYDAAVRYAGERSQFGQPIGKFQAVQFKLVDMLAQLEQAKLYTYYAATLADKGAPITIEAALAKIAAGDGCNAICQKAMSIFGGYLPETMHLVLATVLLVVVLLFLFNRTWRNTVLPLIAGLVSAIWALGVTKLFGIHFEPLVIVVAVLISARAVSHSVQIVNRFDEEVEAIESGRESSETAAKMALSDMFRPGMLGVIADAGCMAVVALSPIPLLQKLTVLSVVWVFTLSVSAVVLTPVLLSWGRHPKGYAHPLNLAPLMHAFLGLCARIVTSRARYAVVAVAALVFVSSGIYAFKLKIGDANPGSPILWPDSAYNQDSAAINTKFQGVDRMFVVVGEEGNRGLLKKVEVMDNMNRFQRFMSSQPEIGATLSVADVVPAINRIVHEGNPRFQELGANQVVNGTLMFMFESVSEPGDLDRFVDNQYENGAVTLFFRDRQGETIRTAIARIKEFMAKDPLTEGTYQLAGGVIGVMAAVNEIILSGQIEAIALALVVLVILCTLTYRSSVAGMVFMVPVIISNTITFSVMAWLGIGMNINTVPVAALGIGLGVDYSFYIADRIKEELALGKDAMTAITIALHSTGSGVLVTALVLIISVMLWSVSSLRFQAEMAMLMSIWLGVSTLSALLLMPSILHIFQPEFVFGTKQGFKT